MANKLTDKLKETLNTTPKAVRWVLLVAAFIVVLMLLFLLLSKPKTSTIHEAQKNQDVKLDVSPLSADFSNIIIGKKKTETFIIKSTHDAVVDSVVAQDSVDGFSFKTNCTDFHINKDIACKITATFLPNDINVSGDVRLILKWHEQGDSRELNSKEYAIDIPVSVVNNPDEPKPEIPPVVAEPEPEIEFEPYEPESDPEPIIGSENVFEPMPVVQPVAEKRPVKKSEKCSDFAMPGYSTSGAQIGWIKPKDGRYEFHPFSDKDCNNPTGIYNPDTGFITSIDGKGRKIGTDADHVGGAVDMTALPKLKSKPGNVTGRSAKSSEYTFSGMGNLKNTMKPQQDKGLLNFHKNTVNKDTFVGTAEGESVYSSMPYDRTFILRQFKPIPATIVSEVRADPSVYGCDLDTGKCNGGTGIPVRATVDRNVYSDNGRTIIIPTGTLMMGYLTGELPGPYKSIGRMKIKWYQFIRPDGVEFNFENDSDSPYSADSQGRVGVPGYGSTDYIEQMVMPMLTAMIPAAVNMIAPIADTFVNQIDLDNNTVVQSGTVRSSELAKNEVITAWNQVAQKLIVDALDNTTPPFSIAAGTRITVYSPVDLVVTCGDDGKESGKKCAFHEFGSKTRRKWSDIQSREGDVLFVNKEDASWTGQTRGFNLSRFCTTDSKNVWTVDNSQLQDIRDSGYDYKTVLAYCQSQNYQGKTQAKYDAYYQNKVANAPTGNTVEKSDTGQITTTYNNDFNKNVLGLEYETVTNPDGTTSEVIKNPFEKTSSSTIEESVGSVDCNGQAPTAEGCCPGEELMDLGDQGMNCCPAGDPNGACFPPLDMN